MGRKGEETEMRSHAGEKERRVHCPTILSGVQSSSEFQAHSIQKAISCLYLQELICLSRTSVLVTTQFLGFWVYWECSKYFNPPDLAGSEELGLTVNCYHSISPHIN